MGLYLCVFDSSDEELDGVEIGSYADFQAFRDAVTASLENGETGSVSPVLISHSDCDGVWTSDEAVLLLAELELAEKKMVQYPAIEWNSPWKQEVAKTMGIRPSNLLESFFDIDGEPLVERLKHLCEVSSKSGQPIVFQ